MTAAITEQQVRDALKKIVPPGRQQDVLALEMVDVLSVCDGNVRVDYLFASTADPAKDAVLNATRQVLEALPGVGQVSVGISTKTPMAKPAFQPKAQTAPVAPGSDLPGVKHIIAVSSGKGGVGKTSVSVNLACALQQAGQKVGIVDADIYGPNVPIMMGLRGQKLSQSEDNRIEAPENYGVKVISIGFLIKEEQPVVWRGPMLDKVIRQFLTETNWGELDVLIVDLPPGTGDAQLTIMQAAPLAERGGAIIVTTPQTVAIHDSRKGLAMFQAQNIPVLGIVENMSYFRGDDGREYEIFGRGGGRRAAQELNVPFLGEVPIVTQQRKKADAGVPIVVADPECDQARRFHDIAAQVLQALGETARTAATVS
ncbi:MAG: Mrp/NBP35 family ATP-binding protein [Candidatus Melainabacteria bacterium]